MSFNESRWRSTLPTESVQRGPDMKDLRELKKSLSYRNQVAFDFAMESAALVKADQVNP